MTKRQPSAKIFVQDAERGLRELVDRRFDDSGWAAERVVPASEADDWMAHLYAEMEDRGWQAAGISQVDIGENSGTLSVTTTHDGPPRRVELIWERARGGALRIRGRPADAEDSSDLVESFLAAIERRHAERRVDRSHQRAVLTYLGLPWRGELWLQDDLRLGPPSKFPESLIGPQAVVVDAMCDGIGKRGIHASFDSLVSSLRRVLGFVLGLQLRGAQFHNDWVPEIAPDGRITDCVIRPVGYVELNQSPDFPTAGHIGAVPREPVRRPDLGRIGIWPDMTEEWVPDDIEDIWSAFRGLGDEPRARLLRAADAYRVAQSLHPEHRTAAAAYCVVACETLKPPGEQYDKKTIYDVVTALLGSGDADRLRGLLHKPQKVRNQQFHRGELAAGELLPRLMFDDFHDPSFDQMLDDLWLTTRVCLIEWVRRGGL
jgi:hypothetical protein